jgi:hypothetical protein
MALYKLLENGVLRSDGVSIPNDEANRHWQEYQAWLTLGNTPDPADEPSPEEIALQEATREAPGNARGWFNDHPNAKLIWSMTVSEIDAEIASLVDASFASLSGANRTRWKLLLTGLTLAVRVLVKRERLD